MNWLWFIPILLVMVIIHEFGHFITAKIFGMKVHEFGIGFPPKVWSKKTKDGMEWSINALPIGGFVRIEGENGDSDDPNSFGAKPTWQRAIVLAAGPFMNLVLAFVIYLILAGGGRDVPNAPTSFLLVQPNTPAAQAGLQPGDVVTFVNGKPVNSVADFQLEAALTKAEPVKITYLVQGDQNQVKNVTVQARKNPPEGEGAIGVVLGYRFDTVKIQKDAATYGLKKGDTIASVNGQPVTTNIMLNEVIRNATTQTLQLGVIPADGSSKAPVTREIPLAASIDMVFKESDANRQGLKAGDQVVKLDDTPITTAAQYNAYMKAHAGQDVQVFYLDKNKQQQRINVKANLTDDANATNRAPRVTTVADGLAIEVPTKHISFSPIEMVGDAWNQTVNAITLIPRTFGALFNGSVSINSLAGPVGMAQITDTVATNAGFLGLLTLTALLSVNLGIVNILPLPALDGGRLVFVIIEFITRGRRIPPEKEGLVHFAGMILLLSLMVFIAWNDIVRLVTGGSF